LPQNDPPPVEVVPDAAPDIAWVAWLGAAANPEKSPARPLYLRPPDARPQAAALPTQDVAEPAPEP
jgi:tRNA threonylcarbamoyladenosine biosynthesis protein TsaB